MDGLCLKAGIHGMPPTNVAGVGVGGCLDIRTSHVAHLRATAVGRSSSATAGTSMSVEKPPPPPRKKNSSWGFSFRYPLRSLWPGHGGKSNRFDAMAVDDAVLVEDKDEERLERFGGGEEESEGHNGNWVLKILHVQSLWKQEEKKRTENGLGVKSEEEVAIGNDDEGSCNGECECEGCRVDDDEKIKFDRESFSKLLKKVSLAETRLYAQMSYLGNIAYAIPQIKPKNLLRHHGLRFVTSSLEKKEQALKAEKEQALKAEKEKALADGQQLQQEKASTEAQHVEADNREEAANKDDNKISSSAAYEIAVSAASYLHSYTKNIIPFRSSKSTLDQDLPERTSGSSENANANVTPGDVASFMATTDSMTSVVAAKEEVKQAVADDLNSTRSSPCEWFICDDDQSGTRYFVIQGSESLASWQANLLFEPIKFEGLDVLVHRGIYEAAKGIYEQMLPEVRAHLKVHGSRASFRFTGHSLGGSLSLLVNLMLLIREEVQPSSLLPVITFGSPAIMCGGDRLLHQLRLPRSHVQSITMHRDIVPRAFSCNYPNHVAEFLKAVNGNFRNHPCLNSQKLLYAPMGEFLILQPDEKFSPHHDLLPSGSGLYLLRYPAPDSNEAEKQIRSAQTVFLNSPHPLEILSDRSAYGTGGSIQRDHDMNSYLKSIRNVIRQDLNSIRKARRQQRRKIWFPLLAPPGVNAGVIVRAPVALGYTGQGQFKFSGIVQNGRESFKRFSRLIASQHMHLLVVLLFPARLLVLGTYSIINFQ